MTIASEILTSHKKFYISPGLDRISKILNLLNNPQDKFKIIHVAGTNGKGSTSKIINEILIQKFKDTDVKIGLFTSPHLFSYTERIKINNENISDNQFDLLINEIDNYAREHDIELTEFELLCAVAFQYFYLEKVEYVILEVGLGGLYDATNVVKKPLVEIITELDFDHTQRLGSTIDEIAQQKAGIIKQNSKVAFLKSNKGYNILKNTALEKNAEIIKVPDVKVVFENGLNYAIINSKKYEFNLLGAHQADNLALALAGVNAIGVEISSDILKQALKNVQWRFRLEYHKDKNILIDGAHNPSGIRTLRHFLDLKFKNDKKIFIFGCLNNKDYKSMLDILIKQDDEFYFYEFNYPNALKFNELEEKYQKKAIKLSNIAEIEEIINKQSELKVFCGSLYMLGQVFSKIKLK